MGITKDTWEWSDQPMNDFKNKPSGIDTPDYRELLKTALELFENHEEFHKVGTDVWAWGIQASEALSAMPSETACRDSARLNLLAEITNLVALEEAGAMLTGDQKKLMRRVGEALSAKYELHRRTNDTPEAFRLSLDEAMKEVGHGR